MHPSPSAEGKGDTPRPDGAKSDPTSEISPEARGETRRAAGKRHHRRSSREAIDALHVPGDGSPEASTKASVRTPAELKNPFVP